MSAAGVGVDPGGSRPGPPRRADFPVWRQATTRWADIDVYGHMNNARYFELIDTVVNAHLAEASGIDIRTLPAVGVVAEVSCRYFRQVGYPEPVDLGLAVERLGRTSVVYRVGVFQGGVQPDAGAAAEGRFVHVYVPAESLRGSGAGEPTPVPEQLRAVLAPLSAPGAPSAQ